MDAVLNQVLSAGDTNIENHRLSKSEGLNDKSLHEVINDVFSKSLFNSSTSGNNPSKSTSPSKHSRPAYVLDLKLELVTEAGFQINKQNLANATLPQREIEAFLKDKVSEALKEHGLLNSSPKKSDRELNFHSRSGASRPVQMTESKNLPTNLKSAPNSEINSREDSPSVKRRRTSRLSLGEIVEQQSLLAASQERRDQLEGVGESVDHEDEEEVDRQLQELRVDNHSLPNQTNQKEQKEGLASVELQGMDRWVDPTSKRSYFIDQRTGNSFESHRFHPKLSGSSTSTSPTRRSGFKPTIRSSNIAIGSKLKPPLNEASETTPSWLKGLDWKSPTFDFSRESSDDSIPRLGKNRVSSIDPSSKLKGSMRESKSASLFQQEEGEDLEIPRSSQSKPNIKVKQWKSAETKRRAKQTLPAVQSESRFFSQDVPSSQDQPEVVQQGLPLENLKRYESKPVTLEVKSLKNARVVAQVDRKFIACVLSVERKIESANEDSEVEDEGDRVRIKEGEAESLLVFFDQHASDGEFDLGFDRTMKYEADTDSAYKHFLSFAQSVFE